jgi:uncharacterized protein YqjF (DUF2071 family)
MYKAIVEAIADYFEKNNLSLNGQPITHITFKQWEETWHGIYFAYDTALVESVKINICPHVDCDVSDGNIFLEIDPIYKDNRGEETLIYRKIIFPTNLDEVNAFCERLVNEYIPNILANKDILTLSEQPTTIPF